LTLRIELERFDWNVIGHGSYEPAVRDNLPTPGISVRHRRLQRLAGGPFSVAPSAWKLIQKILI